MKKISLLIVFSFFVGLVSLARGKELLKNIRDVYGCKLNFYFFKQTIGCDSLKIYLNGRDLINKTNFKLGWNLDTNYGTLEGKEVLEGETGSMVERIDVKAKKLTIYAKKSGFEKEDQTIKKLEIDLTDHEGIIKKYCGWDKTAIVRWKYSTEFLIPQKTFYFKNYPGWYCFFKVYLNDKNELVLSGYDLRDGKGNDWYKVFDKESVRELK